jgi:phage terminase Nu1 subunit (DNA packaging protein)
MFGVDRLTLKKRLDAAGHNPNEEGLYTVLQAHLAISGDIESEKLRLTKEQADKVALENCVSRREYIPVQEAVSIVSRFAYSIRQKIMMLGITAEEKRTFLDEIEAMKKADYSQIPEDDATL